MEFKNPNKNYRINVKSRKATLKEHMGYRGFPRHSYSDKELEQEGHLVFIVGHSIWFEKDIFEKNFVLLDEKEIKKEELSKQIKKIQKQINSIKKETKVLYKGSSS